VIGYLVSAAAYALLLIACLTVWRRRLTGSGLAVAIAAQLAWSLVLAAPGERGEFAPALLITAEYLRALAWVMVLTRWLSRPASAIWARRLQRGAIALVGLLLVWAAGALLPGRPGLLARGIERYWLWGALLLAIAGLVLVEQVVRNTASRQRWSLKYIWLSVGVLFGWDLCLYSIAMLHGSLATVFWTDRGFLNALLAVLLAVSVSRIQEWDSAAFLSPRIVFFSATLLGTALYVLVMAGGSYWVRRVGGSWGEAGQLLFLAVGALALAVAVLSEQFRAWSRVTVAKYLFPYRYDYRAEWQKLTRALSEESETPLYERIARIMGGFVSATNAGLWLRDAEGVYVPAGGTLAPPSAPRESGHGPFFVYLRQHEWICNLDEAREVQPGQRAARLPRRAQEMPTPPRWMLDDPRLWAVVPLICENVLVGFVVIAPPLAAVRLSWEELDLLRAAGRQVASFLAFEQAAKRLAEAHQFEALNRLSAVLMHDLRHLIAQQALVVQNAARHRGNPDFFDDAILTIDNSVKRMTRLMDQLRSGVLTEQTHRAELADLCAEAIRRCAGRDPTPVLEMRERAEVVLSRDRLLQVLEHLIRNAQDATPASGSVTVSVHTADLHGVIEVRDTGCGMDAAFIRERLFRPFETTKGERGFGIGAYQAREFVRSCGGTIEVDSAPGRGTRFTVRLPLAPSLSTQEVRVLSLHEFQSQD
jgi:putative PEP-CTERM system histidine kinase